MRRNGLLRLKCAIILSIFAKILSSIHPDKTIRLHTKKIFMYKKGDFDEGSSFIAFLGMLFFCIGLILVLFSFYNWGVFLIVGGLIVVYLADKRSKQKLRLNENEIKSWHEANEIVPIRKWDEVITVLKIKSTFIEAGYDPNEANEMTRIAVKILKDWSDDWTVMGPTKFAEVIQAAKALRYR